MPETCRDCQQSARHLEDPTARCAKHSPSEIASESWTSNSLSVLSGEANEATKSYHIAEIRRTLAALRTALADAERERDALAGLFGGMARELGLTAPHDEPANVYESVEALTAAVADAEGREKEYAAIFRWLLGEEGDFPESLPGRRYGFRSELRARLAALAPSSATPSTETGTGLQQQDQG